MYFTSRTIYRYCGLIFIFLISSSSSLGCESWFHSGPESINSCYLVSSFSTTWDVALGICQFFGSHLLFIETAEEMDYSLSMLNSSTGAWIGLNDIATEGSYNVMAILSLESGWY